MNLKSLVITLIFISLFALQSHTQRYKTLIGLRADGGRMIGLNLTQRFFKRTTVEVNLDFREGNQIIARGMFKLHKRLVGKGLTLFTGAGVHYGTYKSIGEFSGADVSVGLEHKILILPFTLSFELNPAIHVVGDHPNWYTFQSVFSVKYVLVKHRRGLFRRN